MAVSSEDTQQSLPTNGGGDCFLDIELPEDDPFFDQKKKLLEEKGFAPNERVKLEDISDVDSLNVLVESLVQRARIVHLSEYELYFGQMNVDPPQEFYTPRNELMALNSILSLIDLCIKKHLNENKAFLQNIRDAIVKRIDDFGEKNKVDTKILKEACDNVKEMLQWAESCGVKSKLEIAYVEGAGRGALAAEDLGVGEIALEIPVSVIISEDRVYDSDMLNILRSMDDIDSETMLLLWSMRERHNVNSKHKRFFDSLPKEFNTGLSFGVHGVIALDGTLAAEEMLAAKELLRSKYDELFPRLCDRYPFVFPPEYYTYELYMWACELWFSNSMRIMFPDGTLKTCLIPVAGFLNHSVSPHIMQYGKVDPETNTLKFPLSRPCKKGEQCYLSYGNQTSSHLLIFYGFMPQETNPYDVIPLEFEMDEEETEETPSTEATTTTTTTTTTPDVLPTNTTHMVRGTWLSTNQELFYYGLPSQLLDYLRKMRNPDVQPMSLSKENLENELKVLDGLHHTFILMMEKLGDPEMDDSENPMEDVKLALRYKNMQRKLASSVLSSCESGRKMVELQLKKCCEEDVRG